MNASAYGASPTMSSGRSPAHLAIRADHEVGLVLGLEPADVEEEAAGLDVGVDPVAGEVRRRVAVEERRAVQDHRRRLAVALPVVVADHVRVGDDRVRVDEREPLADGVPRPADRPPLRPLALDAVDVEHDLGARAAAGSRSRRRSRRCPPTSRRSRGTAPSSTDSPVWLTVSGYLPGQVGEEAALDPVGDRDRLVGAAAAAVDGDVVAAPRQAGRQLPRERLEPPVRGRDPPGADDRDAQAVRPSHGSMAFRCR